MPIWQEGKVIAVYRVWERAAGLPSARIAAGIAHGKHRQRDAGAANRE